MTDIFKSFAILIFFAVMTGAMLLLPMGFGSLIMTTVFAFGALVSLVAFVTSIHGWGSEALASRSRSKSS